MLATEPLTTKLSLQAKAHCDGSIRRRVLPLGSGDFHRLSQHTDAQDLNISFLFFDSNGRGSCCNAGAHFGVVFCQPRRRPQVVTSTRLTPNLTEKLSHHSKLEEHHGSH